MHIRFLNAISGACLLIACGLFTAWVGNPSQVQAGPIVVGTLVPDSYTRLDPTAQQGAGASLVAHFALNANFADQTCCAQDSLRWIQLFSADGIIIGVTPIPNRPFIDPRQGQQVPGSATGMGDDMPFYDLTYNSLADAQQNQNGVSDGSGSYFRDDPRVEANRDSRTVTIKTLLVCIAPNMKLGILGGFQWGYTVNDQGVSTPMPITPLSDNSALRNQFNDALSRDFFGWQTAQSSRLWPGTWPVVQFVPEPASVGMLGIVLAVQIGCRRRRTRAMKHRGVCGNEVLFPWVRQTIKQRPRLSKYLET